MTYHFISRQPKAAGVFLLGTNGFISPQSTEYMESACTINEPVILHPFAFRTHTHSLGKILELKDLGIPYYMCSLFRIQISNYVQNKYVEFEFRFQVA